MNGLYQSIQNRSVAEEDIHRQIAEELSSFTKPVIIPGDYSPTPKLAALLCICSRTFRQTVGADLVNRHSQLSDELLSAFLASAPPDTTSSWTKLVTDNLVMVPNPTPIVMEVGPERPQTEEQAIRWANATLGQPQQAPAAGDIAF